MKLNKNELRVSYNSNDKVVESWDEAIEEALSGFGFNLWACGYNFKTGIRALFFENLRREKEEK